MSGTGDSGTPEEPQVLSINGHWTKAQRSYAMASWSFMHHALLMFAFAIRVNSYNLRPYVVLGVLVDKKTRCGTSCKCGRYKRDHFGLACSLDSHD